LSQSVLFHAGDKNAGIFLVYSGQVCLEVPDVPQLSRVFSAGSVLGLPSTFSQKPYSLTAVSATDCDVIRVGKTKFLDLMKAQPELCREATDILVREIAFIFSAIREQHKPVVGDAGMSPSRRRGGAKVVNE
jgi:CRP-like cAMP-binding protein